MAQLFCLQPRRTAAALAVAALTLAAVGPAHAQSASEAESFYRARPVDLIVGYGTGGGFDAYARALAPWIGKHMPGAPRFVIKNMPGAASLKALQFLTTAAPADGSVTGMVNPVLFAQAVLDPAKIPHGVNSVAWIGNMSSDTKVCMAMSRTGIVRLDDLKGRAMTLGVTSQGSGQIYGVILRHMFGENVKLVSGYPSTNDISLAMERGEVDAMCTGWGVIELRRPDWIKDKRVVALTQFARTRDHRLPDTPLIHAAGVSAELGAAIAFMTAPDVVTRPLIAPVKIPADRLALLRRAFMAAMQDQEFLAIARKASLDIDPATGEDTQKIMNEMAATPPAALEFARKLYR
ncbi:MAG: hypothetical protein FJX29_06525 [Alphaproteobacteria bacterium]|nr:hypothetical protein [Alphaproteobacteria bacterium]